MHPLTQMAVFQKVLQRKENSADNNKDKADLLSTHQILVRASLEKP